MLASEYHVYIWQVSPQLRCADTCQIWMRCKESNRFFGRIENVAYGEINERSFSNKHHRPSSSEVILYYPWQHMVHSIATGNQGILLYICMHIDICIYLFKTDMGVIITSTTRLFISLKWILFSYSTTIPAQQLLCTDTHTVDVIDLVSHKNLDISFSYRCTCITQRTWLWNNV